MKSPTLPLWSSLPLYLPSKSALGLSGDQEREADFCITLYQTAEALRAWIAALPKVEDSRVERQLWADYVQASHQHAVGRYLLHQMSDTRPVIEAVAYGFAVLREGALGAYVAVRMAQRLRLGEEPVEELSDEEWAKLQS